MYQDRNKTIKIDREVREYFDNMTLEDLLALLQNEKYKPLLYSVNYKDINVQKMEDKNYVLAVFSEVVHSYINWWNKVPTPNDFANYEIYKVYNRLESDGIVVTEEVKKALYNRRVNSYISFMTEIHARKLLDRLLPYNYCISSSEEMDLFHGVDIVVKNTELNREAYIHVTSNTIYARERAIQKSKKLGRNFTGHMWLYYDKKNIKQTLDASLPPLDTDTTTEVNGFYLFKESYLLNKIAFIEYKMNK